MDGGRRSPIGLAESALRHRARLEARRPEKVHDALDLCAKLCGTDTASLQERSTYTFAFQVAQHVGRRITGASYPTLARIVDRHWTSVRNSDLRIADAATQSPIINDGIEAIVEAVRDGTPLDPKRIDPFQSYMRRRCAVIATNPRAVLSRTAAALGVSDHDIYLRRTKEVVAARQIGLYLSRKMSPEIPPANIAKAVGFDRGAMHYAIAAVTTRLAEDPEYANLVARVEAAIVGPGDVARVVPDSKKFQVAPRIGPDDAIGAVCAQFGVEPEEILSEDRDPQLVTARQAVMFLLHREGHSFRRAAVAVGRSDHTTAAHAVRSIARRIEAQPTFAAAVETLAVDARAIAANRLTIARERAAERAQSIAPPSVSIDALRRRLATLPFTIAPGTVSLNGRTLPTPGLSGADDLARLIRGAHIVERYSPREAERFGVAREREFWASRLSGTPALLETATTVRALLGTQAALVDRAIAEDLIVSAPKKKTDKAYAYAS